MDGLLQSFFLQLSTLSALLLVKNVQVTYIAVIKIAVRLRHPEWLSGDTFRLRSVLHLYIPLTS